MIKSSYDEKTGISKVTLADRYGQYTGIAKLHPEDAEFGSKISGCRLAELRAWKKCFKNRARRIKAIIKGIDTLGLALAKDPKMSSFIEDISDRYTKVLHQYEDELKEYEYCLADIDESINHRLETFKKLHKDKKE